MNRCHFLKELSAYLDNQLPEERKLEVEKHLRECKICSQELAQLRLVSRKLKTWQLSGLGSNFEQDLRTAMVQRELGKGELKMKKKTLAIMIPSGVLAGILVLVFLGGSLNMYSKRTYQGGAKKYADQTRVQPGFKHYEPYYMNAEFAKGGKTASREEVQDYNAMQSKLELEGRDRKGAQVINGMRASDYAGSTGQLYYYTGTRDGAAAVYGYAPTESVSTTTPGVGPVIVIQPIIPATGEGDKIIRTGTIKLEVENGKQAYKLASEICQELGGYLASSSFYKDKEGREAGTITMRIPKDKFTTALDRLGALGKVENISTDSQDVSQEYAALKSQLDAALVVYNKMLEALQKRQVTIPEAMRLESELTPILNRVAQLKNKIEYLNNAVSFTTVTINFHEPQISTKTLAESRRFVKESLISAAANAIRFLAQALPVVIVVLVSLGVAFGIVLVAKIIILRLFKRG